MLQIQELEKLTGNRYLVKLEDGTCFPLYQKELDEFHICKDGELPEQVYTTIIEEILPKRAKLCAMHFLEKLDRTEHQLRQKLVSLFYPEDIVELAVAYVKKFHYIDDYRYAQNYIEYRKEKKSMRQIKQELMQKGIGKDQIEAALEEIEPVDEGEQIVYWLSKKHFDPQTADQKEKEKLFRFLLRKGYTSSAIMQALRAEAEFLSFS